MTTLQSPHPETILFSYLQDHINVKVNETNLDRNKEYYLLFVYQNPASTLKAYAIDYETATSASPTAVAETDLYDIVTRAYYKKTDMCIELSSFGPVANIKENLTFTFSFYNINYKIKFAAVNTEYTIKSLIVSRDNVEYALTFPQGDNTPRRWVPATWLDKYDDDIDTIATAIKSFNNNKYIEEWNKRTNRLETIRKITLEKSEAI